MLNFSSLVSVFLIVLFYSQSYGQSVGINSSGSSPETSSMLDVNSTSKGLLIPRMSSVQRDAIGTPATGLLVFVNDDSTFYYFDGSIWTPLLNSRLGWLTDGNSLTNDATNFVGTTDAQDWVIKTNNNERIRIGNTSADAGITVKGIAAQTGNLFEVQDNSGNTYALINANGEFSNPTQSSGVENEAFGSTALRAITSGHRNTAMGWSALSLNETGFQNVAMGNRALLNNISGAQNVAIGFGALSSVTSQGNIGIGFNAGNNITTGNRNIVIGFNIDAPVATGTQQLTIGNLIYGIGLDGFGTFPSGGFVGIGTNSPTARLDVNGDVKVSGDIDISQESTFVGDATFGSEVTMSNSLEIGNSSDSTVKISSYLGNSMNWNPTSIGDNVTATTTITVVGADPGDLVTVGHDQLIVGNVLLFGHVTSSNTVTVTMLNKTGAPYDLPDGVLRVGVWQH